MSKKWTIDSSHSAAGFSVRHMMIANVTGLFGKMTGTIHFDPPEIASLSVEAQIEVGTLTTGYPARDEHLLSPDFFDVANYPKIIFRTTQAEAMRSNRGIITGDLTMRGKTHSLTLEFEYFGPVKSPFGGEITIGFAATGEINREDYGIAWNEAMPDGGVVVGKEVKITLDVESDLITE
jgi:polyisoprenoid-binding protein YceI